MKTLFNQCLNFLLGIILIMSFSCSQTEETNNNDFNQTDIEKMLVEMKRLAESKGKMVTFEMKNFKKKDYKQHFEVIENSERILAFALGTENQLKKDEENFTVTCTWGNGEVEVTECHSLSCAGQATWDCLDEGGCATVCGAKITYIPYSIKQKLKQRENLIEPILEKVENISNSKNQGISFIIATKNGEFWLKEFTLMELDHSMKANSYQVDCYDSEGELLWIESYPDRVTAAEGILDCTDAGGCAEICEIHARYMPKKKK